jgi:hypothetical protein
VLGEYGGVGIPVEGHLCDKNPDWGYVQVTREQFATYDREMMQHSLATSGAGSIGHMAAGTPAEAQQITREEQDVEIAVPPQAFQSYRPTVRSRLISVVLTSIGT